MIHKIRIANAHSSNKPTQKVELTLEGGSPWFTYVWINDRCYTIIETSRGVKIEKTKFVGD